MKSSPIQISRRNFLSSAGALVAAHSIAGRLPAQAKAVGKADHTLRIESCNLEIGPNISVKTLSYNGKVPGPLLKLREGVPVSIEVTNAASEADIVHWHGLAIDSLNDGAMEEGSPMIGAGQYLLAAVALSVSWLTVLSMARLWEEGNGIRL